MTTIFVCGTSEIKLKAVQEWVDEKGFNYQVKSIKVSTNLFGFPEQPMELHEGEGLGLMRIALSILELKDEFKNGDLIVSFENYITKEFEKEYSCFEYQDKCICQVRSWSGFQTIGFSNRLVLPESQFEDYQKNEDRNKVTFGSYLESEGYIENGKDPHLSISGIPRYIWLKKSLEEAFQEASDSNPNIFR